MNIFLSTIKNTFIYKGRASRKEYWIYFLFFWVSSKILSNLIGTISTEKIPINSILIVLLIALILPYLSVTVRRLHDTGRRGYFIFIYIILPLVVTTEKFVGIFGETVKSIISLTCILGGFIYFLIIPLFESEPNTNRYGPNPYAAR